MWQNFQNDLFKENWNASHISLSGSLLYDAMLVEGYPI